ncbi:MAG: hypothetical protein MUF83_01560 [Acidimicrobiales bacterium]|jgi:hypothetical protein|nr:hypothetical protein [Acidimicrobiales bacterium]
MSTAVWGQPRLFPTMGDGPVRFRLRIDGGALGPVVASLSLATAQARAAVVAGHGVEIVSFDGTVAAVRWAEGGFRVTPCGPASWPDRCARLLDEHG